MEELGLGYESLKEGESGPDHGVDNPIRAGRALQGLHSPRFEQVARRRVGVFVEGTRR